MNIIKRIRMYILAVRITSMNRRHNKLDKRWDKIRLSLKEVKQ